MPSIQVIKSKSGRSPVISQSGTGLNGSLQPRILAKNVAAVRTPNSRLLNGK